MLLSRFCLNKEGGGQEFRSLEVRRKLIALKIKLETLKEGKNCMVDSIGLPFDHRLTE